MATYKNIGAATINLGSVQVASGSTVTDSGFDYLLTLKWFYQHRFFQLTDGTDTYLLSRTGTAPTIQLTAASWKSLNPILSSNQKGIELDTGMYKFGDGSKSWANLAYSGTDIVEVTATNPGSATLVAIEKLDTIEPYADVTDAQNVGLVIDGATAKTPPVLDDRLPILDSDAEDVLKTVTVKDITSFGKSVVTTTASLTSTTTLTTVTGLAATGLKASTVYNIDAKLFVTSTANTGFKCAFAAASSLTATFMRTEAESKTSDGVQVEYTVGTALTDTLCDNAAAVAVVTIKGTISVNVGGTLQLKVAPHASHADTFSILTGSTLSVTPIS